MSNRLHLAKKHIVEYANAEFFKDYEIDALTTILDEMEITNFVQYENDTIVGVVIEKNELKNGVEELKGGKYDKFFRVYLEDEVDRLGGRKAVELFFDYVIKNGDSNDDYYHLAIW